MAFRCRGRASGAGPRPRRPGRRPQERAAVESEARQAACDRLGRVTEWVSTGQQSRCLWNPGGRRQHPAPVCGFRMLSAGRPHPGQQSRAPEGAHWTAGRPGCCLPTRHQASAGRSWSHTQTQDGEGDWKMSRKGTLAVRSWFRAGSPALPGRSPPSPLPQGALIALALIESVFKIFLFPASDPI